MAHNDRFTSFDDRYEREFRRIMDRLGALQRDQRETRYLVNRIFEQLFHPGKVSKFIISQELPESLESSESDSSSASSSSTLTVSGESTMAALTQDTLTPIAAGSIATFTANPVDSNGNPSALPTGIVPTWTSSDNTNAPIVAGATGLTASITVPATATVGATFSLTVTATLADGTTPSGTATDSIAAELATEVASFIITQP